MSTSTTIRLREDTYHALQDGYIEDDTYGFASNDEAINHLINKDTLFELLLQKHPELLADVVAITWKNKIIFHEEELAKLKGEAKATNRPNFTVKLPRVEAILAVREAPPQEAESEVGAYSEEDHLKGKPQEIKNLYSALGKRILSFGSNVLVMFGEYFIYFKAPKNFASVQIRKSNIAIYFHSRGLLEDPRELVSVSRFNGPYRMSIKPGDDIAYAVGLIRQSYGLQSNKNVGGHS